MKRIWLILGVMVFTDCTPARAGMTVYAIDGLARIRPDDPPRRAPSIVIRAARNEYEPLQVIVHAGREGLRGVNATISDFKGRDGAVINASHVTFYREQYVKVEKPSPRSKEGEGWYPDALVPFHSPMRMKSAARFGGAPFNVKPDTNQPLWIDVFVPPGALPGVYLAVITVTAEGQKPGKVTVQLTVWNFTLPETASMRSNFGKLGTDIAEAHKVEMNSEAFQSPEWNYGVALADHRISPIIPNTIYPRVRDDGSLDISRTHRRLALWMKEFHVTGFPLRLLGDDPTGRDRARNITHLRAMYAYLRQHGWEKVAYVYVLDEPNSAAEYEEVRRRAKLVHEAEPGLEVLCTEQPEPDQPKWGTLVGSVDIWVPLWTMMDDASIRERLRAGEDVWSYTAQTQGRRGEDTPYWEIDFPLLEFRMPMWMSWRHGLTGLLYWSPVWWSATPDMWTDPGTYRVKNDVYNGEGALFYPGSEAGINGPVVSMRLKQIREGFEDYEYLKILADRGDRKFAEETVRTIARSWTDWTPDSKALYDARGAIARHIVSGE